MVQPDIDGAIAFAIGRLHQGLSPALAYHNAWHTEGDVLPAVARLAIAEGVTEGDLQLLRVAAAYHDVGFVAAYKGHELESVRIAEEALPQYGFTEERITRIVELILSTRLPRSPRNHLEEILDDADLDALGREDFFERGEALRHELLACGEEIPWLEWQWGQLELLRSHRYFTKSARRMREAGVRRNMRALEALLGPQ